MKYIIGTRGSRLSLAQTNWIISELQKANSNTSFEIKTIKTSGDSDARPLFTIDRKGIFEKEIDKAVSDNEVDFAVHSLKDVPTNLPSELTLACVPKREEVNDILITKDGLTFEMLPSNAIIGTSSLRRAVQIQQKRNDLKVKPIRGNIETRIKKLDSGEYDGVVLALAGILRLKLDVKFSRLSLDDFFPSPGQGALAIITRSDNLKTIDMLKKIEDQNSRIEIETERALSQYVDSGCRFPVGAYAKVDDSYLNLSVSAFSIDGQKSLFVHKRGPKDDPVTLGRQAAEELQNQGISELALNWREKVEEWNKR